MATCAASRSTSSGGNGMVTLPGVLPATHRVKSVNARATVDAATHIAKIDRVDIDFGATKVLITGAGERKPEGQVFSGRADVKHIPVDRLGDYWPLEFAVGGRQWALGQSQQRRDRHRRRVCAERPGQRHGRDQGRSPGRPARLSRHDGALHAAHARAAGRVGQGALRGRHAAFRRGERHHRQPQDGRRHHRPHRPRRAGAAARRDPHADHRLGAGRHPLPGAAQARPAQGRALRLPPAGRRGGGRPVARLSAAQFAGRRRSRPQGRGVADALLAAGRDRRRRPHRRHGAREVRQLGARRQRHGQARRQCRRDRLARAVRRQGAVPPPLRAQGHDTGGAGRQGGLPVARALPQRADRHDALLSGGDQRHGRGGRPLRHQGGQGRRGAARLDQAARRRGRDPDDHEARRRRQAHDHRRRRPRQRPERQGRGALHRRQRPAADHRAAAQARPDRRRGRLEARPRAASRCRCAGPCSSCRACTP